jgi:hypothetical protein
MKHITLTYFFRAGLVFFAIFLTPTTWADLPKRDLIVELRQVEEGEKTGYSVSTQSRNSALVEQHVQVRNGEKASVSVGRSIPMQWVQSAATQSETLPVTSASASSKASTVTNGITWMDAGQIFKVQPRWSGAKQPVTMTIEVQTSSVGDRVGAELPEQLRSQMATTISAPLDQWVTIARSGSNLQRGVYGSDQETQAKRLLQIRVRAP